MAENLLALDQSSRTTGYSIFQEGKLVQCGHFSQTDPNIGLRLVGFRKKIIELIEQYKINEIAFEDIQLQSNVGNNVATLKALAEVYGVLHELCEEMNIPYTSVYSSTWKSGLQIRGRTRPEQKKAAQNFIREKYNLNPTQDEADSACIGTYILNNKQQKVLNWD